jgi:ribosomal protein L18
MLHVFRKRSCGTFAARYKASTAYETIKKLIKLAEGKRRLVVVISNVFFRH